MGFGVDVVGIVDERAGNQLPKLKSAAAARNGQQILGKPPACIERQAIAADFFATQQGFKTGQRSHGVNFVCVLETGQDIGLLGGLVGISCSIFRGNMTDAVTADYIGMWFVDDIGIGMAFAYGTEQIQIAVDLGRTVADRCIIFNLTGNEDHGFVG